MSVQLIHENTIKFNNEINLKLQLEKPEYFFNFTYKFLIKSVFFFCVLQQFNLSGKID